MSALAPNRVEWPVGDLEPALRLQLKHNGSTQVINLTTAVKVTVTLRKLAGAELVYSRDAVIIDAAAGIIDIVWQPGDPVEAVGEYRMVARIIWPVGRPQTVPTKEADRWTLRVHRADA